MALRDRSPLLATSLLIDFLRHVELSIAGRARDHERARALEVMMFSLSPSSVITVLL